MSSEPVSLLIATPFYNMSGMSPYITSLVDTIKGIREHLPDLKWDYYALSGDSYVDRARDTIAYHFLKSDHTHLLFIDSDMAWTFNSFLRILTADAEIVGAAYPCKNSWDFFGINIDTQPNGTPVVMTDGLICASIVPAGFCKIRKVVFQIIDYEAEKIGIKKYMHRIPNVHEPVTLTGFFSRIIDKGKSYGEDVSFCMRAKKADSTVRIRVEPRCDIWHYGTENHHLNYHDWLSRQPQPSQREYESTMFPKGSTTEDKIRILQEIKKEEDWAERLTLEEQDK